MIGLKLWRKVMIENLRLKNSVTALGEEYYMMRRMDTK